MLELNEISKTFVKAGSNIVAVDRATLRVDDGEFMAVQGASGSGKTTLLLMAGALSSPDSGSVLINGVDLYLFSPEKQSAFRSKSIGFVFQQFFLVPYLSVLDNIQAAALGLPGQAGAGRAMELVEKFGLADRAHHLPGELSMGEKQRTALARALFNDPPLILADEPTGNLDEANGKVVLQYLADFAKAGGSVMLVTHDPRAADYATKTVTMDYGKMV